MHSVSDTSPEVAAVDRAQRMEQSGAERFRMEGRDVRCRLAQGSSLVGRWRFRNRTQEPTHRAHARHAFASRVMNATEDVRSCYAKLGVPEEAPENGLVANSKEFVKTGAMVYAKV